MKKNKSRIVLPFGKSKELAKVFGITPVYVSYILNGHRGGKLAQKVRHTALKEFGGVEVNI